MFFSLLGAWAFMACVSTAIAQIPLQYGPAVGGINPGVANGGILPRFQDPGSYPIGYGSGYPLTYSAYTPVAVTPPQFGYGSSNDVWYRRSFSPSNRYQNANSNANSDSKGTGQREASSDRAPGAETTTQRGEGRNARNIWQ